MLKLRNLLITKKDLGDQFWPFDPEFEALYDEGMGKCGLPVKNYPRKRRRKFLVLEHLSWLANVKQGDTFDLAEIGVFKGVLTYMMAKTLLSTSKKEISMDLFDSFEGLSEREKEDKVGNDVSTAGIMKGGIEEVSNNLAEFTFMNYYKGWIPDCFNAPDLDTKQYDFVSIDVDLYKPIKESLEFFYPKLRSPGVIVVDDYGTAKWPGVKQAVTEFCDVRGLIPLRTTLGLAILIKS